ncbi:MAG TPA: hypothetical protein VF278_11530 [Pirellulales bacterium]
MKTTGIFAILAATTLWASSAVAGDDGSRPTTTDQAPRMVAAVSHGPATVTNVAWRPARRYGYSGYRPYSTYRPYYRTYGYGGYYTRPYYGYSYYAPGWGWGGWRAPYGYGVPPLARLGAWYW